MILVRELGHDVKDVGRKKPVTPEQFIREHASALR